MIREINVEQGQLFATPFEQELDLDNRWVKFSKILPWNKLNGYYYSRMDKLHLFATQMLAQRHTMPLPYFFKKWFRSLGYATIFVHRLNKKFVRLFGPLYICNWYKKERYKKSGRV